MADAHSTVPSPTQAHAFLGVPGSRIGHVFRFNPDTAQWGYKQNSVSTDTIGGRVVQLLSVAVDAITIQGRAGSRGELQRLAENVSGVMDYQIRTLRPVTFRVPSRRWDFHVYVTAMPQMGWDVASTSYPYSIQFEVVEDLTGVQQKKLETAALLRLYEGIGYNPAVHGGEPKAFEKVVNSVLAASASGAASLGGGGRVTTRFYKDPFRNANISAARIDAGVDYCGTGPVTAIGPGVIVNVGTPSGTSTFGHNMAVYQLTDGPASGKYVFFAEHYRTAQGIRQGQVVDANTTLYYMDGCIEIGWSDGSGSMAWNSGLYAEGQLSALGKNFNDLLVAMGTKSGLSLGRPITGSLPSGWPTNWNGRV